MRSPAVLTYKIDKTGWAVGPWMDEPDRMDWEHAGLPCVLLRNDLGVWCGYVGLPAEHPLFGHSPFKRRMNIRVHGGLNWAGKEDGVWWLGFDCGHAFDLAPGAEALARLMAPELAHKIFSLCVYRDVAYARGEVESLATQLRERAIQ